jgi:ABC-type transporter Mla MlaB component
MTVPAHITIHFEIRGPIRRDDLPGLCARVCALLARERPAVALCDCATVGADAVTVDALARLQLAARRAGCQVRLRGASRELTSLVALMGLGDVLVDEDPSAGGRAASARPPGRGD